MLAGLLVAAIYCTDALYGERRDRSVLFWKSLPVADVTTVMAKLCVAALIIPVLVWASTVLVYLVITMVSSAVALVHHDNAFRVWGQAEVAQNSALLLFHLIVLHGLYAAPLYAWLLLVSAWAPRAPFMWAVLPPVAIAILERLAVGSTHFVDMTIGRLSGGMQPTAPAGSTDSWSSALMPSPPMQMLTAPSLWLGLVATALLVTLIVRQRRRAYPL